MESTIENYKSGSTLICLTAVVISIISIFLTLYSANQVPKDVVHWGGGGGFVTIEPMPIPSPKEDPEGYARALKEYGISMKGQEQGIQQLEEVLEGMAIESPGLRMEEIRGLMMRHRIKRDEAIADHRS